MQTTLLGLAIALILALAAALVGPLLIDWGTYRSLFEAEASHLVGVDVRVTGTIDARLLPSPRLTLRGIEVGSGGEKVHVDALGIEFALGPLLRGEWRADELHLDGPQFALALDAAGHLQAPDIAVTFDPDALSIDRLGIENGRLTLTDAANGGRIALERFWFNGEARSLIGPFKGEGAVTVGGDLYPYRVAAGRYAEDGTLKLRLNVDPVSRPLSIDVDGALTLSGAAPRFDGTLNLARPVGIAARRADEVTQPWRVSGKVAATAQSALMQNIELLYGSEEQGQKLTGDAEFTFGKRPRLNGVLSGRQIDLDRLLARSDGARVPPAEALRQWAELAGSAVRPAFPIQLGIGVDQVTLGGSNVQNFRGDISTDAEGWNLDRFEFRAPGFTQVRLSGRLAVGDGSVAFTGPAEIDARDPKSLAAWLEGRGEIAPGELRPLNLRGDVTLGSEKIAVDRLKAEFDRKAIAGRLAYVFATGKQPAKLDAALNAPELDIDAALGFGKALLAGSRIERPRDMTIAADIGRASFGGVTARDASARIKVDAQGLQIDKLAVADVGGGSISASGHIATGGRAPRGALALDFESGQTAAIAALLEKFAPATAKPATGLLGRIHHAKLHATLDIADDRQTGGTVAQMAVAGALDAMNVGLRGRVSGDWEHAAAADMRVDGTVDAPDSAALVRLLGLDRYLTAGKGAGQLKLLIAGPADREQQIDVRLIADGLFAQSYGRGRVSLDGGLRLNSSLEVAKVDLRPLRPAGMAGSGEPLPFNLTSRLVVADRAVSFNDFHARLGGSTLRGNLAFDRQQVSGAVEANSIEAPALLAAAIGMPAPTGAANTAWSWSSEPFAAGALGAFTGRVAVKAQRVDLLPQLVARDFRATLRLGKDEIAIDDMAGNTAGGRMAAELSLRPAEGGLKTHIKFSLAGADAASILRAGARPPVSGTLGLSAEVEGSGLSPIALIGSLQGAGKFTLADAQFAALDPRAFDAVTRAVDQGLAVDAERISGVVSRALDSGQLAVKRAQGTLAVSAGQVRLTDFSAESKDADLSLSGTLDLTEATVDARLVLSGAKEAAGSRPDIYMALKGPISAPTRSIDLSALSGWLTLRAVENQAKQLRAIEQAAPKPETPPLPASPPPMTPLEKMTTPQKPAAPIFAPVKPALRAPATASEQAPVLPPPLDIRPLPAPAGTARPEVSIDPQN